MDRQFQVILAAGKIDVKRAAVPGSRIYREVAAVRFYHLFADQKTKSGTACFGRLKRGKKFRKVFRRHTSSSVDQFQTDIGAALVYV